VLGAGHGGCAAAADLGARGYSVRLHTRNVERLAALRAQGGIAARGVHDGLVPIDLVTADLGEAVRGADLIMLVVPSLAHEAYACALAPLLDGKPILLNPGHTGGACISSMNCVAPAMPPPDQVLRNRDADLHRPHGGASDGQHLQPHDAAALCRIAGPTRR
jgi:hypothetical protein